jgi:hypothetical protein
MSDDFTLRAVFLSREGKGHGGDGMKVGDGGVK